MTREDEIRCGLRDPNGVLDTAVASAHYCAGYNDFVDGKKPPAAPSLFYRQGRDRALATKEMQEWQAKQQEASRQRALDLGHALLRRKRRDERMAAALHTKMAAIDAH